MIRRSLIRAARFCTRKQDIQQKQSSFLTDAQGQLSEIPLHLKPYDKAKYQVPTQKIKKNSGFAMVQIQPFPRARIMKICYNLLADLRKGIPEDDIYRIFSEEKYKYIMETVDKVDDVEQLERMFGIVSIEVMIMNLGKQFEVIEAYRTMKPWEKNQQQQEKIKKDLFEQAGFKEPPKYPAYKRPIRVQSKLL